MAAILVVEDERQIAEMISDVLTDEGYHVHAVYDGASALLSIEERPPNLVLLDIALPVMTGDEVLKEVRRRGFTMPIIAMSAGHLLLQMRSYGATDLLPKPFDLTDLLARVEQYVQP
jgi:DNA-binding response OmpR family regulator